MSKWNDGVDLYVEEMREYLIGENLELNEKNLLDGAKDWKEYSYGGSALIYDDDIAERLATPSEIRRQTRKDGLSSMANANETWLDVQARALYQASRRILRGQR